MSDTPRDLLAEYRRAYEKLHDMVSEMVECGDLIGAGLDDQHKALTRQLVRCVAADHHAKPVLDAAASADVPALIDYVRQMARLITPRDPDQVAEWCAEYGRDPADMTEEDLEEMEADLSGDRVWDDATASYHMIREARAIVARMDATNPTA